MCPESLAHYAEGDDARVGEEGTIRSFQRREHRFTMYARTASPDCPICLPDGSAVSFTSLPAAIRRRIGTVGPVPAVLLNGTTYVSTFLFKNGVTATISELEGAVFQVTPSIAEIDHEASRVMRGASDQIANERQRREPVTAA